MVVKIIEISKFVLNQETPIIQKIDQANITLVIEKVSKLKSVIMGAVVMSFKRIFFTLVSKTKV